MTPIPQSSEYIPPDFTINGVVLYRPQEKQLELHTSDCPYTVFGGSRGGGKTHAAIWEAIMTCHRCPGINVLFLRRILKDLKRTVVQEFLKLPGWVYSSNPHAFNRTSGIVTFDNGSTITFGACQHEISVRQYLGASYGLIVIEEFSEFTPYIFENLKGCNRTPIKTDMFGRPVFPRMIMTTNPGGPGHAFIRANWLRKEPYPGQEPGKYKPEHYKFIKSTLRDNATYANDQAYIAALESLPAAQRQAYLIGSWDTFEGAYFDCFDRARSVIHHDEVLELIASQPWQPHWISMDIGFQHAASVSWACTLNRYSPNGTKQEHTVKYREYVVTGLGESALAQEIIRLNRGQKLQRFFLSPEACGEGNSRQKIIGDIMVANKLPRPVPASNNRVEGWRYLHELLNGDTEYSTLLISDQCPKTIDAIPMALTNPKKLEDVLKTDAESDDVLDDLRYLTFSRRKLNEKPADTLRAEAMAPFIASGNLTQAYLASLRFDDEQKRKTTSFHPKRRRRH